MLFSRRDRLALAVGSALAVAASVLVVTVARGHDGHAAPTPEEVRVYEFYAKWMRPKGPYAGIAHRKASCCNRTDCFPVTEMKVEGGQYVVRLEGDYKWYLVPPSVVESNQEDPRESPDARSHVCIIAGQVVCFVEGAGI